MPIVVLPGPLREYADGEARHRVEGDTVTGALAALTGRYPALAGWMLDERGTLRRHLAVFKNGDQCDQGAAVAPDDQVMVMTSISGGSDHVELLVGTKKGLVVLSGDRGAELAVSDRTFVGTPVEYAVRDRHTGTVLAAAGDPHFGPRIHLADDPGGAWRASSGPAFPADADAAVERVWVIAPGERTGEVWAGVAPAALFRSRDGGETWELVRALWDEPSRANWAPGAGGLCLHSICTWPGEPDRLLVGISVGGIWVTEDGGETWTMGNEGLKAPYMPDDATLTTEFCIHHVERAPNRPERLYMQFHGGVYRSDDGGHSWVDIAPGLPSNFGFPIVVDPANADHAFVIPLNGADDRVTEAGCVSVWETGDAGESWTERTDGLPGADSYLTILRQAFCHDGRDPLGLYFGATSGELFGSVDGGQSWHIAAKHLPPVLSVRSAE